MLLVGGGVLCTEVRIKSTDGLIEFSINVNSGTNYSGTTVFLDSDIDFSGKEFVPIGNASKYFLGTFDGQGHTISNLTITSSSQYIGLFGYSEGLTIKNIVMDSSCSVVSSSKSRQDGYIGGIIGYCDPSKNLCIIENTVNMGNITFNRSTENNTNAFIGGIAGRLYSSSRDITVKNCANYGYVAHIGSNGPTYIGGIIGHSQGASVTPVSVLNCLNYGSLTNNNIESSSKRIGGIAGHTINTKIENCVSAGKIISNTPSESFIGGIVGFVQSTGTIFTHCLWTSDVGYDNMMAGYEDPEVTNSSLISSLNTTTISEMNEYAEKTEGTWSRWVMLHLNGGSVNNLGGDTPIGGLLNSLPVPVKEGESLLVWCVDEECNVQYDPETTNASEVTDLYAFWSDSYFNVTFDFDNGTTRAAVFPFNDTIVYPEDMRREGHAFNGWSPNPERMPGKNIIIKAQWNITTQSSEFVEIVFGKADLNEEGAREIIEKYADGAKFTIENFEKKEDKVIAIVKFEDVKKATNFIEKVRDSSDATQKIIRYFGFHNGIVSFSPLTGLFIPLVYLL